MHTLRDMYDLQLVGVSTNQTAVNGESILMITLRPEQTLSWTVILYVKPAMDSIRHPKRLHTSWASVYTSYLLRPGVTCARLRLTWAALDLRKVKAGPRDQPHVGAHISFVYTWADPTLGIKRTQKTAWFGDEAGKAAAELKGHPGSRTTKKVGNTTR